MRSLKQASRTMDVLAVIALILAMAQPLQANLTVTSLDDSGPGSLRQAIADAAPGDTIDFAVTGTITLTSGELVITNDLTITGPGATNLTVSGNNASRVLQTTAGTVRLSGITIANGSPFVGDGGGIYNSTSLTISNCAIINNVAGQWYGGGIFNTFGGSLVVQNSRISNNGASQGGGGVMSHVSLVMVNTAITSNGVGVSYGSGGGCQSWGSIAFTNVTVSGNSANKG